MEKQFQNICREDYIYIAYLAIIVTVLGFLGASMSHFQ